MTDSLRELLLSIVPDDGSAVGNLALAAAMREIVPDLSDETYQRIRDGLIAEGALGKGRGRGGSVFLLGLDDDDDDEINNGDGHGFALTAQEPTAPSAPKAASGKKKAARKADGPVQVLSYRHTETRVNNPEVGMVHPDNDPDQPKTVWKYDPHLDPELMFDSQRGAVEKLIDDALASGDADAMRDALVELKRLVETFLRSDKIDIPSLFHSDAVRRRILIALNIDLIVRHVLRFVTEQNTTALTPVFDEENPIGSTGQMRAWYTTKPNMPTGKSHISHVVGDSAWEQYAANVLESRDDVIAYAKNDHLGFQIHYLWQGSRRRYIPDFIVRLANGKTLALEIKGTDSEQNKAKREALDEWVQAVNSSGGFGEWS